MQGDLRLSNVCVVLVQPQNAGNIGAVARSMMNFGFSDLRLVLPQCDPLSKESRDRARLALPLIQKAKLFMSVEQSVADCQIAWGTSGKLRGASPDELSPQLASRQLSELGPQIRLALVLGPEDRGLNNDELKACDAMIVIPTHEDFPSMNLSHAATVLLHEFSKALGTSTASITGEVSPAPNELKEAMYAHLQETLAEIGFLDPLNPERIMRDLRNILGRSRMDAREVSILRGICRQILNFKKRS